MGKLQSGTVVVENEVDVTVVSVIDVVVATVVDVVVSSHMRSVVAVSGATSTSPNPQGGVAGMHNFSVRNVGVTPTVIADSSNSSTLHVALRRQRLPTHGEVGDIVDIAGS